MHARLRCVCVPASPTLPERPPLEQSRAALSHLPACAGGSTASRCGLVGREGHCVTVLGCAGGACMVTPGSCRLRNCAHGLPGTRTPLHYSLRHSNLFPLSLSQLYSPMCSFSIEGEKIFLKSQLLMPSVICRDLHFWKLLLEMVFLSVLS